MKLCAWIQDTAGYKRVRCVKQEARKGKNGSELMFVHKKRRVGALVWAVWLGLCSPLEDPTQDRCEKECLKASRVHLRGVHDLHRQKPSFLFKLYTWSLVPVTSMIWSLYLSLPGDDGVIELDMVSQINAVLYHSFVDLDVCSPVRVHGLMFDSLSTRTDFFLHIFTS